MSKSQGVNKRVAYKKESAWGELPGATGAKVVRRVSADFNLTKDSYESGEIRTDKMTADLRHGVRSADGSINGELSPSAYSDFMASVVARDFTAVTGVVGAEVTIAASGTNFTITRTAGDYLADGIRVGQVVRLTGAGLNAANVGNNLLVIAVSALVITVQVLSSVTLIPEGPITPVGIAPVGKQTYVPKTGHTEDSYTVEQMYVDVAQSEVYTGLKVQDVNVQLPATGLVTADISFLGKDLTQTGTTEYFTTPTAAGTNGIFASVQGALLVNGSAAACITSADFTISRALEAAQCVGSNSASEIFSGRITVTGNLSAYFSDATLRDYFNAESLVTIVLALTTSEAKDAQTMTFVMPAVKFSSFSAADAELGITQSIGFTSLLNTVTTGGLIDSVIQIQDSTM